LCYTYQMDTNDLRYNVYNQNCPSRRVLDMIADKWTTLVIGQLGSGPRRFSEIQRETDGISQKMLTQTLRELERNGIVQRTVFAEVPPRVEYALTPLGEKLFEPLAVLRVWAEAHIDEVSQAQQAYDAREKLKIRLS
jgi:DNA-binding HxlR family transcriptional regulator